MNNSTLKNRFIKYVSLNILGMLGISFYILADTFFVARGVGADGLAALNLAIPIYSFIHGSGLMVGMGGATRFTITKNKNIFAKALKLSLLFSGVFFLAGILLPGLLATVLGADTATHGYTKEYLRIIMLFSPMFILNNVVICFVRNDGGPRLSMTAMVLGSLSNIVLDYIFIFPLKMGMFGAALATGIAPMVSLLILSQHFKSKTSSFSFKELIGSVSLSLKDFKDICSLGVSTLVAELSSGIVIIVFNLLILKLEGNRGVAAYGILANIALVIISIFTGIAQGAQPIISHAYGRGNQDNIRSTLKYGLITTSIVAAGIYILTLGFSEPIVSLFNKDGDMKLAAIATTGLKLYFSSFLISGLNIFIASYFSSLDKPKYSFILSMMRGIIVVIPAAVILSLALGINGVWISVTVTEAIVLLVSLAMLNKSMLSIPRNIHNTL